MEKEWFEEWFDSPYYDLLYQHRNEKEAASFVDALCERLKLTGNEHILDLACGKGRHSIYLNTKGFDVTGIDLSANSIGFAQRHANDRLRFYIHDMRNPLTGANFDLILNLFTSFGYFDSEDENIQTLRAVETMLKPDGIFVLDFLNSDVQASHLVGNENKTVGKTVFNIKRTVQTPFIVKDISVKEGEKISLYQEKVRMIGLADFERYFQQSNLRIVSCFGDYNFSPFIAQSSERMIFILTKVNV